MKEIENRYFDVFVEYAKGDAEDISCASRRRTVARRRPICIFLRDSSGHRPVYGGTGKFQQDSQAMSVAISRIQLLW
jgi:hypothetical protein